MKYRLSDGSDAEIGWDIDGWDWDAEDFSWLSSHTILPQNGFFISGGYIRHRWYIPPGHYTVETFLQLITQFAENLKGAEVIVSEDTGGGGHGFWVEGVRPPNLADVEALMETRKQRDHDDTTTYRNILKRHPEWQYVKEP